MVKKNSAVEREHDFALVIGGVGELSRKVEDALFKAGCDDATFTMRYGKLYGEFSRSAGSLKDAILSALRSIRKANIGARVERVDDCGYVSQADIARRIERSRQLVHQYISGVRGPGGFPAPAFYLAEDHPLWMWCAVSLWLVENGLLRREEAWDARAVEAINSQLSVAQMRRDDPGLVEEIRRVIEEACGV